MRGALSWAPPAGRPQKAARFAREYVFQPLFMFVYSYYLLSHFSVSFKFGDLDKLIAPTKGPLFISECFFVQQVAVV